MSHDPQQHATSLIDTDIIISASAGSGKTFTLIERLKKRIIEDGLSIDQICALTFTDAAASEMKERLLSALIKERTKTGNERLTKEISLVETAQITTIHGFCLNIIKNYGYILNLDPDRTGNILNPGIVTKLRKKALDLTLQKAYKRNDEDINLLLNAFVDNPAYLETFEKNILDASKYLAPFTKRQEAIEDVISIYNSKNFSELPLEIQAGFFDYYIHQLSMIHEKVNAFISYIESFFATEAPQVYRDLQYAADSINELLTQATQHNLEFHEKIPMALETLVIPSFRAAFKEDLDQDLYKVLSDEYAKCVNDLLLDYEPLDAMFLTLGHQKDTVQALLNLALEYLSTFDLLKEEAAGYDFDDFIYYAMMILEHNNYYIADILKEHYKEIMVDEFQDTNNLQNNIIKSISKGNNIFRVGDLKQSIYGFQGARPALMRSMLNQPTSETIHFKYNYRSKENIVQYNNTLFQNLMNTLDGKSYDDKDLAHVKDKDFMGNTNIQTLNPHTIDFNIYTHGEASNRNFDKQQAMLIADTIYDLMNQGLEIDTREEHGIVKEPLDFKHITVLVRGHSVKTHLKEAFDAANIPHNIVNHQGFFQSDIMKQTIDWLRYYITKDDYYLVSMLASPFIAMTLDDISSLRIHSKTTPLIRSLEHVHPEIYEAIITTFETWDTMSLVDALIYLSTLNKAYSEVFSLQAKTNFDFLLEKASTYELSNNPTILGFVHFIDALSEKSRFSSEIIDRVSESRTLHKEANFVNIATMHASKGLQYPLTIIWPDRSVNQRDSSNPILIDDLYTLSLKDDSGPFYTSKTSLLRTLSTHKQAIENIEEYLRLFYVAMTRATHKLVIVDLVSEKHTLDNDMDLFLIHNFKSASQLIAAGSDHYFDINRDVSAIDVVEYEQKHSFETSTATPIKQLETFNIPKYDEPKEALTLAPDFYPDFLAATQYGTTLHQAIETLPLRKWNEHDVAHYSDAIKRALLKYNADSFTQELYTYKTIEQEMPVLYTSNNASVQGIIDFYAVSETHVVLVDFKSDATDLHTLKDRYKGQIDAYKKALEMNYQGLDVKAFIYSFYHDTYLPM